MAFLLLSIFSTSHRQRVYGGSGRLRATMGSKPVCRSRIYCSFMLSRCFKVSRSFDISHNFQIFHLYLYILQNFVICLLLTIPWYPTLDNRSNNSPDPNKNIYIFSQHFQRMRMSKVEGQKYEAPKLKEMCLLAKLNARPFPLQIFISF